MATLITVHDFETTTRKFHKLTLNADHIAKVRPIETAFNVLKNESKERIQESARAAKKRGINTVVFGANNKFLGALSETDLQLKYLIKTAQEMDAGTLGLAISDPAFAKLFNKD